MEPCTRRGSCASRKTPSWAKRISPPKKALPRQNGRRKNADARTWRSESVRWEHLRCGAPRTKMRGKARLAPQSSPLEVRMLRNRIAIFLLVAGFFAAAPLRAQLGKTVIVSAGSEVDHQLNDIAAANDPAAKLKLIDAFSAAHPDGDLQILADEQYVNYYLNAKQYDKVFEYGDKLVALDPDNFSNAVSMVRAANEKGDTDRLFAAGEKASGILQRFKAQPPPAGTNHET